MATISLPDVAIHSRSGERKKIRANASASTSIVLKSTPVPENPSTRSATPRWSSYNPLLSFETGEPFAAHDLIALYLVANYFHPERRKNRRCAVHRRGPPTIAIHSRPEGRENGQAELIHPRLDVAIHSRPRRRKTATATVDGAVAIHSRLGGWENGPEAAETLADMLLQSTSVPEDRRTSHGEEVVLTHIKLQSTLVPEDGRPP